jgi:hypothetical protein
VNRVECGAVRVSAMSTLADKGDDVEMNLQVDVALEATQLIVIDDPFSRLPEPVKAGRTDENASRSRWVRRFACRGDS